MESENYEIMRGIAKDAIRALANVLTKDNTTEFREALERDFTQLVLRLKELE